ncbi:MAG: hypothetical protein E7082_02775 [Bacteroidales bacterium]|nr:hypothetical protein [Bacteroidales bacterium]
MKKILITLLTAIIGFGAMAQDVDPNRLMVIDKSQSFKGFVLDNVDYLEFRTVEGEVAADVEVLDVTLETVTVKVMRTESCQAFKITCVPTVQIANYTDDTLARVVEENAGEAYFQDFEMAQMSGMVLEPTTDYSILTLGYDIYGIGVEVRRADFTTPNVPVVGNPEVTVEEVDIQQYQFTLRFTPNADVSRYAVVAGEKGTMQSQYEMFAPMFGYNNFGQMIEQWGVKYETTKEHTWTSMQPNTEYEVFIQTWDVNDTMADYAVYNLKTGALGGEGTAEVTITLGDYKLADWNGEMLPSQFITYTPNDQASAYRFNVYLAEEYDPQAEAIKADLCSEPPMPMSNWFFYDPITTDYQINPNTEVVVIAAAKNINNEWGPVNELRFTTPAEAADPNVAPSSVIKQRKPKAVKQAGVVPVITKQPVKLVVK